jgi:hypothetical protein
MVVCVKNIQKLSSHLTVNMLLVSCNDFRSVLLGSPFLQDLPLRHPVADCYPPTLRQIVDELNPRTAFTKPSRLLLFHYNDCSNKMLLLVNNPNLQQKLNTSAV